MITAKTIICLDIHTSRLAYSSYGKCCETTVRIHTSQFAHSQDFVFAADKKVSNIISSFDTCVCY